MSWLDVAGPCTDLPRSVNRCRWCCLGRCLPAYAEVPPYLTLAQGILRITEIVSQTKPTIYAVRLEVAIPTAGECPVVQYPARTANPIRSRPRIDVMLDLKAQFLARPEP